MDDLICALPKLLQSAGDSEELLEAAAFVAWRRTIGGPMRGHAVPFRLNRKTLIVAVADAAWKQQLEAISSHLVFRLNSLLCQSAVTFLEFRIDPETVARERQRLRSHAIDSAEREFRALRSVSGKVQVAADAIADEALRRKFLLAAGSYLANQESRQR